MLSSFMQKKISFSLLDTSKEKSHCFGINALACDENNSLLYTAGRDTTIRVWDTSDDKILGHMKCYEHHADWVNDICLFYNDSKLLSCSSDCSVVVTDTLDTKNTHSIHIINQSDYVKKVSSSSMDVDSDNIQIVSGGLEGNVYIHAIDNSMNVKLVGRYETKHSIYSLAVRKPTTNHSLLIASAGSDQTIKLYDPRFESYKPISKLKGHSDNIKSLIFSHDGTKLISGSSDCSIKIWDTRMMKCLNSLFLHEDSVWSLYLSPQDDTSIFTGGRDGSVYIVNYDTSHGSLVLKENFPILSMISPKNQKSNNKTSIWTSTTNSTANEWVFNRNNLKDNVVTSLKSSGTLSPSSSIKLVKKTSDIEEIKSVIERHTPGRVALTERRILNNRRFILTKDQLNNVQMWDLFNVGECKNFGNVDFEEKVVELNDMVCMPSFYSVDIKSGSLTVYLDQNNCTNSVVYPQDLNFDESETTVNLGQKLISALFETWIEKNRSHESSEEDKDETREDNDVGKENPLKIQIPDWVWIGIEQDSRCLYKIRAGDWDGTEPIPEWVVKVIKNDFERKKSKISFHLYSYDDIVPSLEKKLSSEPHVHIKSLSSWIINNNLSKWLVKSIKDEDSEPKQVTPSMIQFLCKDKELKPTMSFGAVKMFYWKSSDDFVIKYRLHPDYTKVQSK